MPTVPLKFYKQAGTYQLMPETSNANAGSLVTDPNELKTAEAWYSNPANFPNAGNQEWAGLQNRLKDFRAGQSEFLTNSQGNLATQGEVAAQQQQAQQIASGQAVNIGTANAPLTMPPGTLTPQQANATFQAQQPAPQPQVAVGGVIQPTTPQATPQTPQTTQGIPTVALQPGATGMDVKKLQDYLVSQGLMTPEQVASGPGIYGPQTTAAVLALQQKLGVDYSSGPGFFGPKTLQALQAMQQTQQQAPQGQSGASVKGEDPIKGQIDDLKAQQQALAKYGLEDTNQITKDAYGNYIPSQGGDRGADGAITPQPQAPQTPTDFIKTYTDNLKAQGTSSIKEQFDKTVKEYADLQNELNGEIAKINDDAWLTEGIRVKRIKSLQEKYEGKLEILTNKQKIFNSLYQQAIAEAKFLTTGEIAQQEKAMELTQQKQEAEDKLIQGVIDGKYKSIKEVNGGLFDLDSGEWIVQPKPAGSDGLSAASVNSTVNQIRSSFDNHPLVQEYNIISAKAQSIEKIINAGVGGPGDLAIVFEFMKGLDPTSVVRETEYASAAKSGNIFAGIFARFNGYLKEEGGFLPENVKQAFFDIVKIKLEAATAQYRNLEAEAQRQIDDAYAGKHQTVKNYDNSFNVNNSFEQSPAPTGDDLWKWDNE